ncbi:DUF3189 family protein [Desulfallas sp. Bu1-1]|uniref:DUF3189 family protein n=1 Tax=Desulfallas sp. Bu1-1 TaxID=2787620 RepID=UPI00189C8EFE|nr:DUF3189 family protein [Desulfallas sp. Bu1-1]MBF7082014.1 DUF3189 family protein [Desulfallas sp. Bu1-1]
MKIIYHCYGGTHSSVTAAAAHLGMLPLHRAPSAGELLAIPYFDKRDNADHGVITLMGVDECGNEICFVGQRGASRMLENLVHGLARHFDIPSGEYKLVNVLNKVNTSMRIGGTMSRRFKWINAGRPLVAWGTVRAYDKIIKLVRLVRARECR